MRSIAFLTASTLPVLAVAFLACGDGPESSQPQIELTKSPRARATSPVSDADRRESGGAVRAFALDLHRQIAANGGNAFHSPLSVTYALAMTWAGARGETADEVGNAIAKGRSQAQFHPYLNELDRKLSTRTSIELSMVNSVWLDRALAVEQPFLDLLSTEYGAGVRRVDFSTATEPSRQAINGWVSTQTKERIPELIPEGGLGALTKFALVNAVTFDGKWAAPFRDGATQPATFRAATREVQAMMMQTVARLPYAEGDDYQAVALPYGDGQIVLDVVVPKGNLEAFEAALDAAKLETITTALSPTHLDLRMPKFTIRGASIDLKAVLEGLGIRKAFIDGQADLTGLHPKPDLYVGKVFHAGFVEIDEKGTKAAAATAVIGEDSSPPLIERSFAVDRPFLFFVRDVETGALIFAGRLVDPTA
jgi:serpin B